MSDLIFYSSLAINIVLIGYILVNRNKSSLKSNIQASENDLIRDGLTHPNKNFSLFVALVALSARVANADGKVLAEEKKVVSRHLGIDQSNFQVSNELFDAAVQSEMSDDELISLIAEIFPNEKSRQDVVEFVEQIALSDGEYHELEKELIDKLKSKLLVDG